jgi:hypothetical protein
MTMTDLSPAAQAVLDAANASATNAWSDATHQRFRTGVAAALRAAADQVLAVQWEEQIQPDAVHSLGINWTRDALCAIAAELESADA